MIGYYFYGICIFWDKILSGFYYELLVWVSHMFVGHFDSKMRQFGNSSNCKSRIFTFGCDVMKFLDYMVIFCLYFCIMCFFGCY